MGPAASKRDRSQRCTQEDGSGVVSAKKLHGMEGETEQEGSKGNAPHVAGSCLMTVLMDRECRGKRSESG